VTAPRTSNDNGLLTGVLAERLTECVDQALGSIEETAGFCAEVVAADAQYRAALWRDGVSVDCAPARELLVEALFGRLDSLRPYLPYVGSASRQRAEERLRDITSPAQSKGVGSG
jgi:hypothetical protein